MPCHQQAVPSSSLSIHYTTLEQRVCLLRQLPSMVDSLDQRIKRQRALVVQILKKRGLTPKYLMSLQKVDLPNDDELILCYNILMDCEYIDSLR